MKILRYVEQGEKMNKGLGVGAMVVAILAIFVPVVGIYVVWGALVLAALAAFMGDRTYPIVTVLISIVNVVFLSPMMLVAFTGENQNGGSFYLYMTIALCFAPIVAMIMNVVASTNKNIEGEV